MITSELRDLPELGMIVVRGRRRKRMMREEEARIVRDAEADLETGGEAGAEIEETETDTTGETGAEIDTTTETEETEVETDTETGDTGAGPDKLRLHHLDCWRQAILLDKRKIFYIFLSLQLFDLIRVLFVLSCVRF